MRCASRCPCNMLGRWAFCQVLLGVLFGAWMESVASSAETSVDTELLELVASTHQANIERLVTWSGRARVTAQLSGGEQPSTDETATASEKLGSVDLVEFAYDRKIGAIRWRWGPEGGARTARQDEAGSDGESRLVPWRRNGLVKGEDFYHCQEIAGRSRNVFGVMSAKSPKGVERSPTGPDFDPTYWLTDNGHDLAARFRYYRSHAEDGHELPGVSVLRNGDEITLEIRRGANLNRYVANVAEGGLLVEYDGESSRVKSRWRYQNVEVNGVWLPREITYEIGWSAKGRGQFVKIEWLENHVNEALADDEFSLVKLGAQRGDIVTDSRSRDSYTLVGEEYPAPAGMATAGETGKHDLPRAASNRVIVLIGGIGITLIALLATVVARRIRRTRGIPSGD
jgi:hypothetical protein